MMKKGSFHTPETRAKMSTSQRGKVRSAETRAKISAAKRGKPRSAETIGKMRAANVGKTINPETRAKIGAALKGRTLSPEHRRSISEAQQGARGNSWKGEEAGYIALHMWARNHFDDPGQCEQCGIPAENRRLEWASIGHTYTRDRSDWRRLCKPCHHRMDKKGASGEDIAQDRGGLRRGP